MKWTLLALLIAGLSSCQDEDTSEVVVPEGELTVMLNGEDFLAQYINHAAAGRDEDCMNNRFVLSSQYFREDGTRRISFAIVEIPLKTGTYPIERKEFSEDRCARDIVNASFHTLISDGDVLGDSYLPIEAENNFITIDSYDQETEEVNGTFQMTLAVNLEDHKLVKTVADAPDTIRLTEGKFSVILEN